MESKRTLILVHLLKHCTPEEKKRVIEIYLKSREKKTEHDKEHVVNLMRKYKSVEYADLEAQKYGQQAIAILKKIFSKVASERAKQQLIDAIEFVYKREK